MGSVGILAAGRISSALIGILALRILTELLPAAEIGRFYAFTALALGAAMIFTAPVSVYVNQRVVEWRLEGRLRRELFNTILYFAVLPIIVSPLLFVFYDLILAVTMVSFPALVWVVSARLFAVTAATQLTSIINALGHRRTFVIALVSVEASALAAAVIAVHYFSPTAESWISGIILGNLLIFPILCFFLFTKFSTPPGESIPATVPGFWSSSTWKVGWPVLFATVFYWMQTQGFRLPLGERGGEELLGIFTIGFMIGSTPIALFDRFMQECFSPWLYSSIAHKSDTEKIAIWCRLYGTYLPLALLTTALIAGAAPYLARILVAEEYRDLGWLAAIGAATQFLVILVSSFNLLTRICARTKLMLLSSMAGGICAVAGVWLIGNKFGLAGPALVLFLAGAVAYFTADLAVRFNLGAALPWKGCGLPLLLSLILYGIGLLIADAIGTQTITGTLLGFSLLGSAWLAGIWMLRNKNLIDLSLINERLGG